MIETKIIEKNSVLIKHLLDEIEVHHILDNGEFNFLNDFYYRLYVSNRKTFIEFINSEFNAILQRTLHDKELHKTDKSKLSFYNSRIQ